MFVKKQKKMLHMPRRIQWGECNGEQKCPFEKKAQQNINNQRLVGVWHPRVP
jgi:hypothetical protein